MGRALGAIEQGFRFVMLILMVKRNISNTTWQDRFDHQKTILFDENDFSSPGTKLQVIKFRPNGGIKPHYHRVRTEAFYILAGEGKIMLDGEMMNCVPVDYILCKPGIVHAFTNTGQEDFIIEVFRTNDPGDSDMLWADM